MRFCWIGFPFIANIINKTLKIAIYVADQVKAEAALETLPSFINLVRESLFSSPNFKSQPHQAVGGSSFSYKIGYIVNISCILNPKVIQNASLVTSLPAY